MLARQVLGDTVGQRIGHSDDDRLHISELNRLSQVMNLHVDVPNLSGHWAMRSFDSFLVVAEHECSTVLIAGDLTEDVSERQYVHVSL